MHTNDSQSNLDTTYIRSKSKVTNGGQSQLGSQTPYKFEDLGNYGDKMAKIPGTGNLSQNQANNVKLLFQGSAQQRVVPQDILPKQ